MTAAIDVCGVMKIRSMKTSPAAMMLTLPTLR